MINLHQFKRYKYDLKALQDHGFSGKVTKDTKSFVQLQHGYNMLDDVHCIYLWGDPGCGKSFMIEEFFKHIDIDPK